MTRLYCSECDRPSPDHSGFCGNPACRDEYRDRMRDFDKRWKELQAQKEKTK